MTKHLDSALLFLFCILVFTYIVIQVPTDIQAHIRNIMMMIKGQSSYPPNFLFYWAVNLFSGFSGNVSLLNIATVVLLSSATVAKYAISKNLIIDSCKPNEHLISKRKISLIALALFFCFAITDPYFLFVLNRMYLGKFVSIVWHNSTTIMLFPFAIFLFCKQLKVFNHSRETTGLDILMINFLVVVNILIKPSFIFVYIPVTFFFLIREISFDRLKSHIIYMTPLLTGTALIVIQYVLIYQFQQGSFQKEPSGISVSAPFEVLSSWIPFWFVPISFILSFAFPIVSAIAYKDILKYKPFIYSLVLVVFGIIMFTFIKETGPRMKDGNFMWQNIICSYLLFLSTVSFLTPKLLSKEPISVKKVLVIGFLCLHVLSGILYLFKIALTSSYL